MTPPAIRRTIQPTPAVLLPMLAALGLSTVGAHAYVDPGTGSYVFQMLIATLTGVFFLASSLKTGLLKLLSFKGRKNPVETLTSSLTPQNAPDPNRRA